MPKIIRSKEWVDDHDKTLIVTLYDDGGLGIELEIIYDQGPWTEIPAKELRDFLNGVYTTDFEFKGKRG